MPFRRDPVDDVDVRNASDECAFPETVVQDGFLRFLRIDISIDGHERLGLCSYSRAREFLAQFADVSNVNSDMFLYSRQSMAQRRD